jgi:hypothetical protein
MTKPPRCATAGCRRKGVAEMIHHHHEDDKSCYIDHQDKNHCIYWLCQHHLDEAVDRYPQSFPDEYEVDG